MFLGYRHASLDASEVTFNLKDFKAMLVRGDALLLSMISFNLNDFKTMLVRGSALFVHAFPAHQPCDCQCNVILKQVANLPPSHRQLGSAVSLATSQQSDWTKA